MVENLEQPSLDKIIEFENLQNSVLVTLAKGFHSLLSLLDLLARRTHER